MVPTPEEIEKKINNYKGGKYNVLFITPEWKVFSQIISEVMFQCLKETEKPFRDFIRLQSEKELSRRKSGK